MNKKLIKTIAIGAVATAAVAFIGFKLFQQPTNQSHNGKDTEYVFDQHSALKTDLPKPAQVKKDTPFLYDFVYSTLGFRANIDATKYWNHMFLVITPKGNYHIESYTNISGQPTPVWGSETVHIKPRNTKLFNERLEQLPKNNKIKEGDYKFYLIPMNEVGTDGRFGGENLAFMTIGQNGSQTYEDGYYYKNIYLKFGWPTEWLRKSPYREKIMKGMFIDMNDPFWDEHNLDEKVIYKANNMPDLEVKTVDVDTYEYVSIDGITVTVNGNQLKQMLDDSGYHK